MTNRAFITDSADLVFRTPPAWPGVVLFGILSLLHFVNCTLSFIHGRIEGYMSLIFASGFAVLACGSYLSRFELAVLPRRRQVRLRSGYRHFTYERFIPFSLVHGVRLTTSPSPNDPRCRIELLCELEDVECPPTRIPRQEALCLAMTLGVRLIKVS